MGRYCIGVGEAAIMLALDRYWIDAGLVYWVGIGHLSIGLGRHWVGTGLVWVGLLLARNWIGIGLDWH